MIAVQIAASNMRKSVGNCDTYFPHTRYNHAPRKKKCQFGKRKKVYTARSRCKYIRCIHVKTDVLEDFSGVFVGAPWLRGHITSSHLHENCDKDLHFLQRLRGLGRGGSMQISVTPGGASFLSLALCHAGNASACGFSVVASSARVCDPPTNRAPAAIIKIYIST